MAESTDVLIIGGGVAGAATAWWLARRGTSRVVLLEREAQLGTQSSGLNAGILRTADPDPQVSELAERGAAFLHDPPPGFSPVPLVDPVGLLLVADEAGAAELERMGAHAGAHAPCERVSPSVLSELVPLYAGEPALALHFPTQGHLDVAALMEGFARGARRGGVEIRTGAEVVELRREGDRVVGARLADGEELAARTTVIAAGGWAGKLGREAGSRVLLTPTRRHLLVTAADRGIDPRAPVLWQTWDGGFYCKPESGGMLISACDLVEVDPDACATEPAVRELVAEKTTRWLPALADAGAAHFWCGMRTLTADDRFAIGFDPDFAGLFWVAGLGGHGMVCGAEIGRLASVLLEGDPGDDPLVPGLDPARVADVPVG